MNLPPSQFRFSVAVIAAAGLARGAIAQEAFRQPRVRGIPPLLERVDPQVADVSPLGESLREVNLQADFRAPTSFQHVYRVPGRDDLYMRAAGSVYAIFPQSVYAATDRGTQAVVPAGAIYSIGPPAPWMLPDEALRPPMLVTGAEALMRTSTPRDVDGSAHAVRTRINPRVRSLVVDPTVDPRERTAIEPNDVEEARSARTGMVQTIRATPPHPSTFLKTIVTDDAYRRARIELLLQEAARAARGG